MVIGGVSDRSRADVDALIEEFVREVG